MVRVRSQQRDASSIATAVQVVALGHVLLAVCCAVALVAAASPSGGDALPGAIRTLVTVAAIAGFAAHLLASLGVRRGQRRARTLSLVANYLTFVMAASAVAHRVGLFTGIGALGEGFNKGFAGVLVAAVGVIWWMTARKVSARTAERQALGATWLGRAGLGVTGVGTVWFVVAAGPGGALRSLAQGMARPLTVLALAAAVLTAWSLRVLWRREGAAHFGTTPREQADLEGLAFLSPNIIGFAIFFAGPLIFSLVISFFSWDSFGTTREFRGLGNYIDILSLDLASAPAPGAGPEVLKDGYQVVAHADWFGKHWVVGARDKVFWISLRNIVVFLTMAVPLAVVPALVLSSILASRLRGMRLFRAIYFVPSVAGVISMSLVWGQLYSATVGWINYLIQQTAEFLPFVDPPRPYEWLSSESIALVAIAIVFGWMMFGFNTVLYLAGHQSIPKEIYEAAAIDNASVWQTFRRLTVPQLRATSFYVVATTAIAAMQLFDIVWVLTNPPGGPNFSTSTPVLHLYQVGFQENQQGYASAVAWVLFLLIFGLTVAQFRRQRDAATAGGLS